MTRIHLPVALVAGAIVPLPDAAAHHVAQVLRMRAGEALTLFNGTGGEYAAEIRLCERRRVEVLVLRHVEVDRESRLALTLVQCVSKGERMDYTVQKAVELGVSAIVPLLSSRSVVRLDAERWDKKLEHWRGVVISACEQSGRTQLPELGGVGKLETWLENRIDVADDSVRLVLAPGGGQSLTALPRATRASLLVGPEGGLSESEIAQAVARGFVPIELGPRVLRTETAGVTALAALQTLWGDLG